VDKMAAMQMMNYGGEVDISSGVYGAETEVPVSVWQLRGGIEYKPNVGQQTLIFNVAKSAEGASQFPLAALAPVLLTGAAKWPAGTASPLDAAINGLGAGEAVEITRHVDFYFGNDFNAVVNALVCKSTIGRSKRGDALEVSTDICVPSKSARQSAALSAEEIAMFASVTKVHDFTETLVHTVEGKKHRLNGDAFVFFETENGRRMKAKLTTTWAFSQPKGAKSPGDGFAVYQIQREIAYEERSFGENYVSSKGEAELVHSSFE